MLVKNQLHFNPNPQFAHDVVEGLSKTHKKIPSKYLYDDKGSELYNQITHHSDYYLTKSELEIIEKNKEVLSNLFHDKAFNCIELGPGEGIKSMILIKQFLKDRRALSYFIIDLSPNYLDYLSTTLSSFKSLPMKAIYSDFNEGLHQVTLLSHQQNLVLFLGSSIGNYDAKETREFLKMIWNDLNAGDYFLIGFDLKKNIDVLMRAYNDSAGLTSDFNLNVLDRMNRELGSNFEISQFKHYATYNVYSSAMESYLISLKKQSVYSQYLNQNFYFEAFEPIHMEYSFKYTQAEIERFAKDSGFKVIENFEDQNQYYTLSLWQVEK